MALGFAGPRQAVLGSELAGEIEAIVSEVTRFGVGEPADSEMK